MSTSLPAKSVTALLAQISTLVRQCGVSLFVGAGFSLKAGAPSSAEITKALAACFPADQQEGLSYLPLDELSERYVRLHQGDRLPLIQFLGEQMAFSRTDLSDHYALNSIPHIRRIFTTNYDSLLEESISNLDVARNDKDCANLGNRRHLYKIHGDLEYPEGLILTKDDYFRLISNSEKKQLLMNSMMQAFVESNVVFVGFSLDDFDVRKLLESVLKHTEGEMRQVYLVAPSLSTDKQEDLLKLKVEYVDATAEALLQAVCDDLNENICQDVKDGIVSVDIAREFLCAHGIYPDMKFSENKISITDFQTGSERCSQRLKFSTKLPDGCIPPANFDFLKDGEMNESEGIPYFNFDPANMSQFEYRINGVKVMGLEELGTLKIGPSVIKSDVLDIIVAERDFVQKARYTSYINSSDIVVAFDTPLYILSIVWGKNGASPDVKKVDIHFKEHYPSYHIAQVWTEFLIYMFSGDFVKYGSLFSFALKPDSSSVELYNRALRYYKDISEIECLQQQSFEHYDKYADGAEEITRMIKALLSKSVLEEKVNMAGRIQCQIDDKDISKYEKQSLSESGTYIAIRSTRTTDNDVILNGRNYGRITEIKEMPKSHIDKVTQKDGQAFVHIAPDCDHWSIRYTK